MSSLAQRYFELKSQLQNAELLAVSKQASLDQIKELYALGQRDFAENRVDQLLERSELLEQAGLTQIRWHFIGNLQSNKIKKLLKIKNLKSIHSVDRMEILQLILKSEHEIDLFLQVKTSPEAEKSGFVDEADLIQAMQFMQQSKARFKGFMTMAPIRVEDAEKGARESFHSLKQLRDRLAPQALLSMGMSDDFTIALEFETNIVRLGSVLFSKNP